MKKKIAELLETRYREFNTKGFIQDDPISLPARFSRKEDREITGFLVALISWGQRKSIIKSGERLVQLFGNQPYEFILKHSDQELKACLHFVHRTFNGEDLISLIGFLKEVYTLHGGMEKAFSMHISEKDKDVYKAIKGFRQLYENSPSRSDRTLKHLASPEKGSACKRINMFLRWMVRKDEAGVDFGIWQSISPSQLICPLDVHVINTSLELELIKSGKGDWKTAVELTQVLRRLDPDDPVKYDFALFGSGIAAKLINQPF